MKKTSASKNFDQLKKNAILKLTSLLIVGTQKYSNLQFSRNDRLIVSFSDSFKTNIFLQNICRFRQRHLFQQSNILNINWAINSAISREII